ncbi:MAG: PEP-CTERM sorting domain-containing protein, partial [Chakrabartia godavariana]
MSVRMALTKLCACACGGAVIGGGAMHATQAQPMRSAYSAPAPKVKKPMRQRLAMAPKKGGRVVKRIKRVTTTTSSMSCAPQTIRLASAGAEPMRSRLSEAQPVMNGGGGSVPVVIGGGPIGGFGGGFIGGGFFGGGSGGGSIVVSS